METNLIREKQDLTYLKWSRIRSSSGTAGSFLKSESHINGTKTYYKLSSFDYEKGIVGHECVNELIVDRLLTILGIEHLHYNLIHADIDIDGTIFDTYLCASGDFKQRGESKIALDSYFGENALKGESHYDFCVRNGWKEYIDEMLVVDYLILNRDRHGANIEVLRNARAHTLRIAPLFDHGVSLLCSCHTESEARNFDIYADRRCNNFIGSQSCYENLNLLNQKLFTDKLHPDDRNTLFNGLEDFLPDIYLEKIWKMIYERYRIYENL